MDLTTILAETDVAKRIELLKSQRYINDAGIEKLKNYLAPEKHEINNRPLREVVEIDPTTKISKKTYKEVNKIPVPLQRIIIERAVSFLFGNKVKVSSSSDGDLTTPVTQAILKIGKETKIDSFNRKLARSLFSFKEVAEYWYTTTSEVRDRYGFKSALKFNVRRFSADDNDKLYPFFGMYGDLEAFSREFERDGKTYFETWTDKEHSLYESANVRGGYVLVEGYPQANKINKIPIVYARQPYAEYEMVQHLIERFENLISNNADTNDRHARPILAAKGAVEGKVNDFVQMSDGAELEYVAWNQATTSIEAEEKMLLMLIYSLSQTSDISFDSAKGLGNAVSGEGIKTIMIDALLKTQNKMEMFDEYLTRRYNLLKSFLGYMNPAWGERSKDVEIDINVTPYMFNSDSVVVENLLALYNAGLISKRTALEINPYVENPQTEYNLIEEDKELEDSSASQLERIIDNGTIGAE